MLDDLRSFGQDESGAVTVDWVVLTATIVGLALGVISIVAQAAVDPAESLGSFLTDLE